MAVKEMKIEISNYRQNVGTLLECLRYAGVISKPIHSFDGDDDLEGQYSFNIFTPKGSLSIPWAKMNAERMRSFGINAKDVNLVKGLERSRR
jgi:hypothetical protein